MAKEPERYRFGTTKVPDDHDLDGIWHALRHSPRERQFVVGELVSVDTGTAHPEDEDDFDHSQLTWVALTAITDKADRDQLAAMVARARLNKPGQVSMADELARRRGDDV